MATTIMAKYKMTTDTAVNWTSNDPVLPENVLCYDSTNKKFKMGDGTSKWSELDYTSADIDSTVQELADTLANKADSATTLSGYGITDAYTKTEVDTKLSSVYTIKGSVDAYTDLPSEASVGDVYNVITESTVDTDVYPAGTNFVYTEDGWDALGGTIDLSDYVTKDDITASTTNGNISVSGTDVAVYKLPLATSTVVGGVLSSDAANQIAVSDTGIMEVNSIDVSKITVSDGDELVLDGGDSTSV